MFSPFQVSPSETSYSTLQAPTSMRVHHKLLTHLSPCTGITLHWRIKHPQAQGSILPLMYKKNILYNICSQHHGSFHVYSLGGASVTRRSRGSGLLKLVPPPLVCKTPQLLQSLLQFLHWGPCVQSNGWLQAPTSVLVRLWQRLSGESHIRLLSACTSWHQQ